MQTYHATYHQVIISCIMLIDNNMIISLYFTRTNTYIHIYTLINLPTHYTTVISLCLIAFRNQTQRDDRSCPGKPLLGGLTFTKKRGGVPPSFFVVFYRVSIGGKGKLLKIGGIILLYAVKAHNSRC
jgi:hypothetical protein